MYSNLPLVTVLTPVYNGEKYLAECIESVINQHYDNWEYIIVNNCSTDGTLEIANRYAEADKRIRIVNNTSFVGVIENHNIAFKLISPESKYCKVVSADDWIYPECITRLVEVAEAHPDVGIVGSYQLSGGVGKWQVKWVGLPYSTKVISGREFCHYSLLGGQPVNGNPTSVLFRSDLIRGVEKFFPYSGQHADTSAIYEYLQFTDFGFVHQILSYERIHSESLGAQTKRFASSEAADIRDLLVYGPVYLSELEFERNFERKLQIYYNELAEDIFHNFMNKELWRHHKNILKELGYSLYSFRLAKSVNRKIMDLLFNPLNTINKILKRLITV